VTFEFVVKKNAEDISKTFSCNKINSYNFFHNSTKNKHGVAILISSKLDYTCLEEYRDIDENILALKISMQNCWFWVVAVYGPNTNDVNFFVAICLN
jgi:exonuclease III